MSRIIETHNYKVIVQVCGLAYKYSHIMGIIGFPGAGKTTTLTHISRNNDSIYYIAATATITAKQFFIELLYQFGFEPIPKESLHSILNRLVALLNDDDSKKLIIVDECTFLKSQMLTYLQELTDKTRETVGLVLAGPYNYKAQLEKWGSQELKGVREFLSRVWGFQPLDRPTHAEIDAFLRVYEIKDSKFSKMLKKIITSFRQLNQEIQKYLFDKSGEDFTDLITT
ncbi:MAG: ATP-binding protein [Salinivirgaceae bacterium]|nr:ATP-binding protein [Salinivirgaceae bacterium]